MAKTAGNKAQHPCCSICAEPTAPSDFHRGGSACAHAFCGACITGHVRARLESGPGAAAAVRCLYASCGGKLDPELCRAALPADVFERWCAALCESMFVGARRTYCPFPDCSEMMVADDEDEEEDDEEGEGGKPVTQSECQVCRRLFCAQCAVPWHADVDCAAYKRGDRSREDLMLMEMAREKKWRRCPKCDFFVAKRDGCLHIYHRCDFQFCYGCGAKWRSAGCSCDDEEHDESEDEDDLVDM
ncbi:probable E3 ubiquitin-protein ligase RNF217 [Triticum dicoccoides]|nr:probable E3 ubiquitin-protein ligase RNF217 [Triticum dicoccoides]